jgi:hypothetical protein
MAHFLKLKMMSQVCVPMQCNEEYLNQSHQLAAPPPLESKV